MSASPDLDRPIIRAVEPQIFVADFAKALAFYVDALGFAVRFTYGEPPFYGQVVRDAGVLDLRHVDGPVIDRSADEDLLSAAFTVSNARKLYVEYQERGVPFRAPLRREPWHAEREGAFIVEDPDGNLLLFAGRTD